MRQKLHNYLSRFKPTYWTSLVYMLQASEYDIREYLAWYHRTHDFSRVARRKRLVMTPKALLLFAYASITQIGAWGMGLFGIYRAFLQGHWDLFTFNVVMTAISPYITAYSVLVPLLIGSLLIQRPRQRRIVAQAREKLAGMKAVKIAVAGSYGKTTMREIMATVLAEGNKQVAAPPASYNTPLGISKFVAGLAGTEEVLVFELGEYYPGDISELCQLVQPDLGVITGVNEAHLSKFKTLERTVNTIFELGDYLGDGPLYINGESELARDRVDQGYPFLYSRHGCDGWEVVEAETGLEVGVSGKKFTGTYFLAKKDGQTIEAESGLLGLHQVGPLLAAAAIAAKLDLTPEQIERGLAKTMPFEHRLQPRKDAGGAWTIDDTYNGNPDGARVAIEFLAGLKGYRRWYVTPGLVEMGEQAETVHREIGRQLAKAGIEKVVLIRDSVTPHVEAGLEAAGFKGDLIWYDDAMECYAALPTLTVAGDVVLLQNDWTDNYA